MYKKILVPLDGSERAEAILPHVESLGKAHQASIIFLGVVELPPIIMVEAMSSSLDYQAYEQHVDDVEQYLVSQQNSFLEKEIDAQIRIGHGRMVDVIIKTADTEGVDLVAMTSHGRTGLAQVFYGSVAVGVLHRVNCPILIIRSIDVN